MGLLELHQEKISPVRKIPIINMCIAQVLSNSNHLHKSMDSVGFYLMLDTVRVRVERVAPLAVMSGGRSPRPTAQQHS